MGGAPLLLLLLVVGCFLAWWTLVVIPRLEQAAEQSWTKIGRSMSAFENNLNLCPENESLRALTRDLEPFGIRSLYKIQPGEPDPNTFNITGPVVYFLDLTTTDDRVAEAALACSFLNKHSQDLDSLYQRILQREEPVWSFNPQELLIQRLASPVAIRQISQLICLDALHRLEQGDPTGAANAIKAGWKMTAKLSEQPVLSSFIIRLEIENLFSGASARLPMAFEALGPVALEIDLNRERWRRAVQGEAWATAHMFDYLATRPGLSWIHRTQNSFTRLLMQRDSALFLARVADHVRTSEQVNTLALSDLGGPAMQDGNAHPSSASTSDWFSELWGDWLYRSWARLNAVLLRREQAEIIRETRARLQEGQSGDLGDRESMVAPGARWHVIADAKSNSASLALQPIPDWTTDTTAFDQSFFLLPLDGSKSWTFRQPQHEPPLGRLVVR